MLANLLMRRAWDGLTPDTICGMSRNECIALLQWNDPNGAYSDALSAADGFEPLTESGARQALERARFGEDL